MIVNHNTISSATFDKANYINFELYLKIGFPMIKARIKMLKMDRFFLLNFKWEEQSKNVSNCTVRRKMFYRRCIKQKYALHTIKVRDKCRLYGYKHVRHS